MKTIQARLPSGTYLAWQAFRTDICLATSLLPDALRSSPVMRQASYLAGRACAAQALITAGYPSLVQLGRTAQGLADWPVGLTGSITHSTSVKSAEPSGLAMALTGRCEQFRSLGIDLEPVLNAEQADHISAMVVSSNEARLGRRLGIEWLLWVTKIYCLKESLFKMLFCEAGVYKPFEAAEVVSFDRDTGRAGLILCCNWGRLPAGTRFWLSSQEFPGYVLGFGVWSAIPQVAP